MFLYHPRAESWGESINFLYIFISHGTVHRLEHWKILLKVCDNNQLVTDSLMKLTSLPFVREDGLPGVEAEPALHRPFHFDFWSRWSRGWWWWRGGRRSGIDLPVLTFHLAAALAIKLAEGRPEAGLPPHKLDRWLTIQPEIKDSELVVFIIKTS